MLVLFSGVNLLYLGLGIAGGTLILVILVVTSICIRNKVRTVVREGGYHGSISISVFLVVKSVLIVCKVRMDNQSNYGTIHANFTSVM